MGERTAPDRRTAAVAGVLILFACVLAGWPDWSGVPLFRLPFEIGALSLAGHMLAASRRALAVAALATFVGTIALSVAIVTLGASYFGAWLSAQAGYAYSTSELAGVMLRSSWVAAAWAVLWLCVGALPKTLGLGHSPNRRIERTPQG